MVGIAQPENFSSFLRKVGYSVGLENTLSRFGDFCHLYSATSQLKSSDWMSLVHDKWRLKNTHIADVFASLGIVQVTTQGVFAGPIGEAGAICLSLLDTLEEKHEALRHLLALAILLSDGDIFFNCLAAEFNPEKVSKSLTGMILGKRQELFEIFKSQAEREAIAGAVTIERQRSNKGGASKGSRLATGTQTGLSGGFQHLGLPRPKDVHSMEPPSADYLRHVIPSRREWARSLGLIDKDGSVTNQGWRWLQVLGETGFVYKSGEFSLRPTKFELESNRLSAIPALMLAAPRTWDYVVLAAHGLAPDGLGVSESIHDEVLATTTAKLFSAFRELAQDRRMMRNELPLHVALMSYMAITCAKDQKLVDYDAWIRSDVSHQYGIKTRSSRTIEIGIIVTNDDRN